MLAFLGILILAAVGKSQNNGLKRFLRFLFGWKYELICIDRHNIPSEGGLLLAGNHQSFIDWAFIILAMQRPVRFVIAEQYYQFWLFKPIFKWAGLVPISIKSSKKAISKVQRTLNKGEAIAIFPEGQLTRNGQLGSFKRGFEVIARSSDCHIVPFYLHGLWGSFFSHCYSDFRTNSKNQLKRKIYIGFGQPMLNNSSSSLVKQKINQISTLVVQRVTNDLKPTPIAWITKAKRQLTKTSLVNFDDKKFKNSKLIIAVLLFTEFIKELDTNNKRIGILLPSSSGSAITNLAGMALGKTVVNLNYTSPPETIKQCLVSAEVRTIYTSSVFLEKLRQRGFDTEKVLVGVNTVILEDLSKRADKKKLLKMAIKVFITPARSLIEEYFGSVDMNDEAAILFSSGSEGTPKGVVLTHRNIAANIHQISLLLAQKKSDCILNSLPPFHAFGLTVTTLAALVEGITQVCAPDPTDAQAVGNYVEKNRVTILFATSTFANLYTRNPKVTPTQFETLRLVVLGAEKLREEVRIRFESKFNKKMYEGFGTTESAPVISVNLPDQVSKNDDIVQKNNVYGSVGLPVPGTACIIVDPETEEELPFGEAGLLLVSGPQLMKGYLNMPDKTKSVTVKKHGLSWYKTGDKAIINSEGFVKIVDRYSRFAKIGGEMVSLTMLEDNILKAIGNTELELLAVALPDTNKGEIIILLISNSSLSIDDINKIINLSELPRLYRPKKIIEVETIPKLGSGKIDFGAAKHLTQSILENIDNNY